MESKQIRIKRNNDLKVNTGYVKLEEKDKYVLAAFKNLSKLNNIAQNVKFNNKLLLKKLIYQYYRNFYSEPHDNFNIQLAKQVIENYDKLLKSNYQQISEESDSSEQKEIKVVPQEIKNDSQEEIKEPEQVLAQLEQKIKEELSQQPNTQYNKKEERLKNKIIAKKLQIDNLQKEIQFIQQKLDELLI